MHSDKQASATRRATIQAKPPPGSYVPKSKPGLRDIRVSRFMITINTNQTWEGEMADAKAQEFADVLDGIGFEGSSCALWGKFFKVSNQQGKRWGDPKQKKELGKYTSAYVDPYQQDDKQGIEHWCSLMEHLHVDSAGVEWATGTKYGKKQYLHAHIAVMVQHRTRLLVDCDGVKKYFQEALGLPHKPYVNAKWINDATARSIEYTLKHAKMNKGSEAAQEIAGEVFGL